MIEFISFVNNNQWIVVLGLSTILVLGTAILGLGIYWFIDTTPIDNIED